MRERCLDEGTLQSYLDGELSPQLTGEAAAHLGACAACAASLRSAESELALFAAAFAPAPALSVPTERLRERIDAAVAERNAPQRSPREGFFRNFGALAALLAAPFNAPPRYAGAFASLVAVVAFATILGVTYLRPDGVVDVARNNPDAHVPPVASSDVRPLEEGTVGTQQPSSINVEPNVADKMSGTPNVVRAAKRGNVGRATGAKRFSPEPRNVFNVAASAPGVSTLGEAAATKAVPGEENYLRAIASLSKVLEAGGGELMKPQMRAEYERNIAVIDKAIEDTRRAALRNPKDADATSFLHSAYQNKIDLLSTVADQAQVATLGR